jgi:hypothetical protein
MDADYASSAISVGVSEYFGESHATAIPVNLFGFLPGKGTAFR